MRKNPFSKSGLFNPRVLVAFILCAAGAVLAFVAAMAGTADGNRVAGQITSPATSQTSVADATKSRGCGPVNGLGRVPDSDVMVPIAGAGNAPRVSKSLFVPMNGRANDVNSTSAATATSWRQVPLVPRTGAFPPSRDGLGSAYDEARQEVVIFGGRHFDPNFVFSQLNDTWTWNGTTWTEKQPTTKPPSRFFTVMAYDPGIGKSVLFGGQTTSGATDLNDTWVWDGSNWAQVNTATSPPARHGASLAYDPEHQKFVLFGGNFVNAAGVRQFLNDTWTFDGTNWSQVTTVLSPTPRSGDSSLMTYVPANHGIILFGGLDMIGQKNDTWLFDGSSWTPLLPATSPTASFDPALTYDAARSRAVLFRFEGETWLWDGNNWTLSSAVSPPGRYGSVYVYDTAVGKVLLALGVNCLPQFDDEWLWDGTSWTQVDLGDKFPTQRTLHANQIAFDTLRNEAVLFSGSREGCSLLSDTWIWNGSAWNWLHPAVSPPRRAYSSMAYDPDRQVTVLFGGRNTPSTQTNDTWVFDGANWTRKFPLQSPSNREGMGMAFDSASRKVILFGGSALGASSSFNETWSWDGSNWAHELPPTSPSGRVYLNMSHDAQGRPIMFGGQGAGPTYPSDTWRWNGTTHNWEQVMTSSSPPGRYAAGMGYDAASQSIILFGGQDASIVHGDTWAFDGSNWQALNPTSSPAARTFPAIADGSLSNPPVLMGGGPLTGIGGGDTWTWGMRPAPVQLAGVVSSKMHGTVGDFDINLPLTGTRGVECRGSGGVNDYTLIFTFTNNLTSVGTATVTTHDPTSGTGTVSGSPIVGPDASLGLTANQCAVNLTNVSNAQYITVTLTNLTDSAGNSSTSVPGPSMGVLLGDVTGNGVVTNTDVGAVKAQVNPTTPVTQANFREDVTVNGFVTNTDVGLVKGQVNPTGGLPSPP